MDDQQQHGSWLVELRSLCERLTQWLIRDAYPSWWANGVDRMRGGFFERLDGNGIGLAQPRRARLHPRQIYAFSFAEDFGCPAIAVPAAEHGLAFFLRHYRREDGLYRTLVMADGTVLSDEALLYDQAFALLGLGAAFRVLGEQSLRSRAWDLLDLLRSRLAHQAGGFQECEGGSQRFTANSHMHLLEAALLWSELDSNERWSELAQQVVQLALDHFRPGPDRQVREFFSQDWRPAPGIEGVLVEPGHQFEWAWLLLSWAERAHDERAATAALELINIAERRGVACDREVAVNCLLADGQIRDGRARLWPQTERIKAACAAGRKTGAPGHWRVAAVAAQSLLRYLSTPVRGLWYDTMDMNGQLVAEPAPASSFYHLVGAIAALSSAIGQATPGVDKGPE